MSWLSPGEALRLFHSRKKKPTLSLGRLYVRLYPIRTRTVRQLAEELSVSQTLIRTRLSQLETLGMAEFVTKLDQKTGKTIRHYTRKARRPQCKKLRNSAD